MTVFELGISCFGFVSDFDIRISDLRRTDRHTAHYPDQRDRPGQPGAHLIHPAGGVHRRRRRADAIGRPGHRRHQAAPPGRENVPAAQRLGGRNPDRRPAPGRGHRLHGRVDRGRLSHAIIGAATISVNVKQNGTSILSAPIAVSWPGRLPGRGRRHQHGQPDDGQPARGGRHGHRRRRHHRSGAVCRGAV